MPSHDVRTARTFRLTGDDVAALDDVAAVRFGGNRTRALEAAIGLASIVYGSPAGRAGLDAADALERWAAARRRPAADAAGLEV